MCQGLPCRTFKESVLGRVAGSVAEKRVAAGALGKQFWGVSMRPQELQGKLFGACRGDCRGIADGRRSFGENVVVSWGVSRAVSRGRWRFSECMESWTVM